MTRVFSSLRTGLIGLVLIAMIPALGFVLYMGLEQRNLAVEYGDRQVRTLRRAATSTMSEDVQEVRELLATLGALPVVRTAAAAGCRALFVEVGRRQELRAEVGLADNAGNLVASGAATTAARTPAALQWLRRRTVSDSEISDLWVDPASGRATMFIARPVFAERSRGRRSGVLFAAVDLAEMSASALPAPASQGTALILLDGRGTILGGWPSAAGSIGRALPEARPVRMVLEQKHGVSESPGLDGVMRLWSFEPVRLVPGARTYLAVGISRRELLARADRDLWRSLLVLAVVILLSSLASWAWGRFAILGPMDALVSAARRVSRGDLSARSGLDSLGGDMGQLAHAFDEMAASLEARESEASQAVAALRETNQTLQAILTAAPLGVIALDREGRVILWTPAAERLFGWRTDEVLGRPMPWVSDDQHDESSALIARTSRGERLNGLQIRRHRKDGRPIELRIFTAPLCRPDGTIYGTVGVMEDVSERKQLEDQLHHSQKMEAVGRLAGGLAHDFNNLLTVIRGYTELALQRTAVETETRGNLAEIRKAVLRANSLIRQLLTFSRQPLGEPRVIDFNDTVAEMAAMLGPLIGEDIRLTVELGEGAGCVHADSGQLAQIITNLVVNARDAMPRGGEMRIETGRLEVMGATAKSLAGLTPGEYCVLTLADTGVGMDADTLQHLFEPFFSTKELWEGTGLGLSTVYGIVTQAGGDIRVTSRPGGGTTFQIYLPRVDRAADRPDDAATPLGTLIAGSGTVLVVEDEEAVRAVVCETLVCAGYTVLPARDGREAIEISESHAGTLDLVVTDVVMPEMGGPELVRRLAGGRPGLKILFMSGYAPRTFDPADSLTDGAAFIAKPFALEALAQSVHDVLSGGATEPGQEAA